MLVVGRLLKSTLSPPCFSPLSFGGSWRIFILEGRQMQQGNGRQAWEASGGEGRERRKCGTNCLEDCILFYAQGSRAEGRDMEGS